MKLTPKKAGYGVIIGPGYTKEFDTCTCKHCNRVWVIRSTEKGKGDPGGWCRICSAPICPFCSDKPCFPFEEKIKRAEESERFVKSIGLQ